MIRSIPQPAWLMAAYAVYVTGFFVFLFAPLVVVAVFAFNDSLFPALPWQGFTLDWFYSLDGRRTGLFQDVSLLRSIGVSFRVALWVTLLSVAVGTTNAFLFERERFPLRNALAMLMLVPLVIPGVILGISILLFSSSVANSLDARLGWEVEFLRPGLGLVVLGQFSFIATITTLVVSARLRKFNPNLEEAALNLGATRLVAVWTVTVPYLLPAIVGAAIVAFLMSFENFNTTLMLVGSEAPLPILMYSRLRLGSTPVINAVSLLLMLASGLLAVAGILASGGRPQTPTDR
jgi:spermidine/putrescine transport system permease protein